MEKLLPYFPHASIIVIELTMGLDFRFINSQMKSLYTHVTVSFNSSGTQHLRLATNKLNKPGDTLTRLKSLCYRYVTSPFTNPQIKVRKCKHLKIVVVDCDVWLVD